MVGDGGQESAVIEQVPGPTEDTVEETKEERTARLRRGFRRGLASVGLGMVAPGALLAALFEIPPIWYTKAGEILLLCCVVGGIGTAGLGMRTGVKAWSLRFYLLGGLGMALSGVVLWSVFWFVWTCVLAWLD